MLFIPTFIFLFRKQSITHLILMTITIPLCNWLIIFNAIFPYGFTVAIFIIMSIVYFIYFAKRYPFFDKKQKIFINTVFCIFISITYTKNVAFNLFVIYILALVCVYYYFFVYKSPKIQTKWIRIALKCICITLVYVFYYLFFLDAYPQMMYARISNDPNVASIYKAEYYQ